jgi:YesN/AraC family two-component response regulator
MSRAQELIALEDFDLVISDINMPGGSGVELLQWINNLSSG